MRVVKVEKEKLEFCYLGDMLSAGSCCELAANVIKASSAT